MPHSPNPIDNNHAEQRTVGVYFKHPTFLLSLAAILAIFSLLSSVTFLWIPNNWHLIPSGRYCLPPVTLLLYLAYRNRSVQKHERRAIATVNGFAWGLLLVFTTDWMLRPYSFFSSGSIRGEIVLLGIICLLMSRYLRHWPVYLLALSVGMACYSFSISAQGRQIISDDASTFFYRLSLLRDNFPSIPVYNPLWNAGIDERAFFATGSLNVFFIFSAFIYSLPLELIYSWIVVSLLVILTPFSIGYATYRLTRNAHATCFAALLALAPSTQWFQWGITYGALGFITAAMLLPLNVALVSDALASNAARSWRWIAATSIVITLMLFWSASGLAFLPLIGYGLITVRRQISKNHLIALGLFLCLINLPWISVFWHVSNVSSFLQRKPSVSLEKQSSESSTAQAVVAVSTASNSASTGSQSEQILIPTEDGKRGNVFRHKKGTLDLARSIDLLRSGALATNPLLLVFGLAGLVVLPTGTARLFAVVGVWLLASGTLFVPLLPQLELDRMVVLLQLLSCIPAGLALACLSSNTALNDNSYFKRSVKAIPIILSFGYLASGVLLTNAIISNRTFPRTTFLSDEGTSLVEFLKAQPDSGRYLFSGCVTHHFDGGHLSSLSVRTGKALVASSPFGDIWWYTDVFPKAVLSRGITGILEHLDILNVNGVFAHEPHYRKLFRSFPQYFRETWHNDTFAYFERTTAPHNFFLSGQGSILEQTNSKVVLKLETSDVRIKFRFYPFLRTLGCSTNEYVHNNTSLIELNNCPTDQPIVITAKNGLQRVSEMM
jgi:hypothetical protein